MMNRKFAMGLALFSGLAFTHSLQALVSLVMLQNKD